MNGAPVAGKQSGRSLKKLPCTSDKGRRHEDRFWAFHGDNPAVYDRLVRRARVLRSRLGPDTTLSMDMLYGVVRYDISVRTTSVAPKLNNNFKSFYARLIMAQEPDLADAFETRSSTADRTFDIVRLPIELPGKLPEMLL